MDFIPQFGAVGAVLSLLVLTLWWLRRRGIAVTPLGRAAGRRMTCLERLPLSPQHSLHLVRMGNRVLLVSSSPAGCSVVERFAAADVEAGQ